MNFKDASASLPIIMLMVITIAVGSFGFIMFVNQYDNRMATVGNDTVNLTGINYSTEIAKATNSSLHMFAGAMPWLVYIGLMFLAVCLISLLAIALKK